MIAVHRKLQQGLERAFTTDKISVCNPFRPPQQCPHQAV